MPTEWASPGVRRFFKDGHGSADNPRVLAADTLETFHHEGGTRDENVRKDCGRDVGGLCLSEFGFCWSKRKPCAETKASAGRGEEEDPETID